MDNVFKFFWWVVENDLGEAIDVIYSEDHDLPDEVVQILEDNRWVARSVMPPETVSDFQEFHQE